MSAIETIARSGEGMLTLAMEYKGYLSRVEFDDEANLFYGEVVNTRDIVTFQGTTVEDVHRAFEDSVDDYLAFCVERGEAPFSGRLTISAHSPTFPPPTGSDSCRAPRPSAPHGHGLHPTLFLRRALYQRDGVFDTRYRIAADYDLMLCALGLGVRPGFRAAWSEQGPGLVSGEAVD